MFPTRNTMMDCFCIEMVSFHMNCQLCIRGKKLFHIFHKELIFVVLFQLSDNFALRAYKNFVWLIIQSYKLGIHIHNPPNLCFPCHPMQSLPEFYQFQSHPIQPFRCLVPLNQNVFLFYVFQQTL